MSVQDRITQLATRPDAPTAGGLLQRKCASCGNHTVVGGKCDNCKNNEGLLRRKSNGHSEPSEVPQIVHEVLNSSGQPLDMETRAFFEPRFGRDFSAVRAHTGARAAESAREVNALAYTAGRDVVFAEGKYAPNTNEGRRLLAHELTHVAQQQSASSSRIPALTPIKFDHHNDAFEREADAIAEKVASSESVAISQLRQSDARISRQPDLEAERSIARKPFNLERGAPLPYREATELAECVRIMGEEDTDYCRQQVLGEKPISPMLRIARVGGQENTFISTDTLTFTAQVINAPVSAEPPTLFDWTVQGISANAGNGNPHSVTNINDFTFTPNPTNRPTTGSRRPNDPIQYRVEARAGDYRGTIDLTQDETDIIRQEYVDFRSAAVPARDNIVAPTIATYNTGNYTLIVDGGMDNALTNTEAQFQALTPAEAQPAPSIGVSSGYRNPRRNVAAGSKFPVGSRHVWGSALDLVVERANATLWDRLRQAGANAGNTSICEDGPTQIACDDSNVDHVHIQW